MREELERRQKAEEEVSRRVGRVANEGQQGSLGVGEHHGGGMCAAQQQ
jgi:hypothetical protein